MQQQRIGVDHLVPRCIRILPLERRIYPAETVQCDALPDKAGVPISSSFHFLGQCQDKLLVPRMSAWRAFLAHGTGTVVAGILAMLAVSALAEPLSITITPPAPPASEGFKMGTATRPDGSNLTLELVQPAGPAREIPRGKISRPVAAEPVDADFAQAAVWRIKLPAGIDLSTDPILRLHYVGDVARVTLNGKLLTDDFYNGNALDVGLRRHAPEILNGELRVAILPLRKDAPIYLAEEARPKFNDAGVAVELKSVEIVPRYQAQLSAK